jgi:hypothetical protein
MFFNQFPKIQYSIENNAILTDITDYFRYVDIVEKLANNLYAYKKVQIGHGERPDVLSQRLYGTPDFYWTFFICNDSLKQGLSAWPKSDPEIKNHIANQYKNISAFRFPMSEPDTNNTRRTPLGIPILKDKYLPYLRLCRPIVSSPIGERIFAEAKIVDYHPNKSLIWIDNSTENWFAEEEASQAVNGSGNAYDLQYKALAKNKLFYTTESANDFTVQFRENENPSVKLEFQSEVREAALRFAPTTPYHLYPSTIDRNYMIESTQYWKDGSLSPAYYFDPTNTDEEITEYQAGEEASNYKSIYDDMLEDNEALKEIKVVAPAYIQSFTREFKKLLNE